MKRFIALLLVFSTIFSLTGCSVTFDKDALVDRIKQEVSDAVDDTVNEVKEDTLSKVDEAFNDTTNWLKDLLDKLQFWKTSGNEYTIHYIAKGATNVPADQVISEGGLFSSKKISKECPVNPGYIFLGWGTYENTTDVVCKPGQKWNLQQSVNLYAVWAECTHKDFSDELYGLDLESEGKALCQQCKGELSPGIYFFSDYLKATQPRRKRDYKKLNEKELSEALSEYIRLKEQSYEAVIRDLNKDGNNVIEIQTFDVDDVREGINQTDEVFQLVYQDEKMYNSMVNKKDTWTFYEIENVKFSIDTFRTIMSAVGTIHSIMSFGASYSELSEETREGIPNTYHIEMQKIDNGIQFAQTLGDITSFFYSLAGGQTVSGLIPSPEEFKETITNINYANISKEIIDFLHFDKIIISQEEEASWIAAFNPDGNEDLQIQKDRWTKGPTAEQTAKYIAEIENSYRNPPEELSSFYFYLGWRIEYECMNVIQMILDDKV